MKITLESLDLAKFDVLGQNSLKAVLGGGKEPTMVEGVANSDCAEVSRDCKTGLNIPGDFKVIDPDNTCLEDPTDRPI